MTKTYTKPAAGGSPPTAAGQFVKIVQDAAGVFFPIRGGRISGAPEEGHIALDIVGAPHSAVYLPVGGRVTGIGFDPRGFGLNVRIMTPQGIEQLFAHLSEELVDLGAELRGGSVIGYTGASGMGYQVAQGLTPQEHLHFEARFPGRDIFLPGTRSTTTAIDPLAFLSGASQPPLGGGSMPSIREGEPMPGKGLPRPRGTGSPAPKPIPATSDRAPELDGLFGRPVTVKVAPQYPPDRQLDLLHNFLPNFPWSSPKGIPEEEIDNAKKRIILMIVGGALLAIGLVMFLQSYKGEVKEGVKLIGGIIGPGGKVKAASAALGAAS